METKNELKLALKKANKLIDNLKKQIPCCPSCRDDDQGDIDGCCCKHISCDKD